MKFTCDAIALIDALQIVTKALSGRTSNPILDGILMETDIDGIVLTCSDERITIVTRLNAQVDEHGRGVVPGKLFNEIVRRLSGNDITIIMNSRFSFNIRSGSSTMNIAGQDAELYPRLPEIEDAREIALPQDMLKKMIEKTEFAIAAEDMREVLTGCLLEIENGNVNMVALDGFRLAMYSAKCGELDAKFKAIIPGRAVGDIGKLLSDDENAFATLSFGGNKLHIKLDNTEVYVILVKGEYVNYRQILPKVFNTKIAIEAEAFRRCVDRAALIAREGNNNLLQMKISDGNMEVEAHSQIGDVHEELPVEQEGADLSIAFNVKYLIDVVRNIDTERIEFHLNNAVSPVIVNPEGETDYVHLVLPVRTGA